METKIEIDKEEKRILLIWYLSFIEIFLLGLILLLIEKNVILLIEIILLFFLALYGSILIILIYGGKRNGN